MRSAMARHVEEWQKLSPEETERQYPVVRRAGPTLYLGPSLDCFVSPVYYVAARS